MQETNQEIPSWLPSMSSRSSAYGSSKPRRGGGGGGSRFGGRDFRQDRGGYGQDNGCELLIRHWIHFTQLFLIKRNNCHSSRCLHCSLMQSHAPGCERCREFGHQHLLILAYRYDLMHFNQSPGSGDSLMSGFATIVLWTHLPSEQAICTKSWAILGSRVWMKWYSPTVIRQPEIRQNIDNGFSPTAVQTKVIAALLTVVFLLCWGQFHKVALACCPPHHTSPKTLCSLLRVCLTLWVSVLRYECQDTG